MLKKYHGKSFEFQWGLKHLTFTQLIDGSKAAWCIEEDQSYWLYFCPEDTELNDPIMMLPMSDSEEEELEFHDIISDLSDATNRGVYAEVSQGIRELLEERNLRREMVFALNTLDINLIQNQKGIVYLASRKALNYYRGGMELRTAIGQAIRECR